MDWGTGPAKVFSERMNMKAMNIGRKVKRKKKWKVKLIKTVETKRGEEEGS